MIKKVQQYKWGLLIFWVCFAKTSLEKQPIEIEQGGLLDRSDTLLEEMTLPYTLQQVSYPVLYKNGILFTYSAQAGELVYLSGDFCQWESIYPLRESFFGVHFFFLSGENMEIDPGKYTYRYKVGSSWVNDPQQKNLHSDGRGFLISYFALQKRHEDFSFCPKHIRDHLYRFFLQDEGFTKVHLVLKDYGWDPYLFPMRKVDKYWIIELDLRPGGHEYRYQTDRGYHLDPANSQVRHTFLGRVNYVHVEKVEKK